MKRDLKIKIKLYLRNRIKYNIGIERVSLDKFKSVYGNGDIEENLKVVKVLDRMTKSDYALEKLNKLTLKDLT